MKKYIVYDENERRPWPDEVTHFTYSQAKEELIELIQQRLVDSTKEELTEIAKQFHLVIEKVGD